MSSSGERRQGSSKERERGAAGSSALGSTSHSERRKVSREGSDHNVTIELAGTRYVVEVEDISRIGARILVRKGLMPALRQRVVLHFMNSASIEAEVIHILGRSAGLSFLQPFPDDLDIHHFDELGSDYFRSILRLQIAGSAD